MKVSCIKKIYFSFGLVVVGLIIAYGFFLVSVSRAQSIKYEFAGWLWSENYGWISLNSGNPEIENPGSDYKVIMEGDEIYGWGWSSNLGWICFGKTCDPQNICNGSGSNPCYPNDFGTMNPPDGGWNLKKDARGMIVGWGKVLSLGDLGRIHFGQGFSVNTELVFGDDKGQTCYDCQKKCIEYAVNEDGKQTDDCLNYSETDFDSCNLCFTAVKFDSQNLPINSVDSVFGGSGNSCSDCSNCSKTISNDGVSFRIKCANCNNCYLYGGGIDQQNGEIIGWAWNGNEEPASQVGVGWIQLRPLGGESGVVYPWLQTLYGTVFSKNKIRQKSLVSGINATYCIISQDVYNFTSGKCVDNFKNIMIDFPKIQTKDTVYKNALGKIDLVGLTKTDKTINSTNYNKYGNKLNIYRANTYWGKEMTLNNEVFVINGDLSLAQGFKINNATNGQKGGGLVVVNGNLHIKSDYDYGQEKIETINQMASVAWVVKGDVIVDSNVKKIVGAFMVLGNNDICLQENGQPCSANVDYPKYKQNGYGVFFSSFSSQQLTVGGLIVSKALDFRRQYSNILSGSESIIYDGRFIANPPPGMKDFFGNLPIVRDFNF